MTKPIELQLALLEAKLHGYELLLLGLLPTLAQNKAIRGALEEQLSVYSVAAHAMETRGNLAAEEMRQYEAMTHAKRLLTLISGQMEEPLSPRAALSAVPGAPSDPGS